MNETSRPSLVLAVYYGFLLLSTGLAYGLPYPLFGAVLTGTAARVALVLDCLVLVHIVIGVVRAQQLTWYLLLAYNAFNLASLSITVAVLDHGDFTALLGQELNPESLYLGLTLSALAMVLATVYAFRFRERFWNRSPYLF